MEAQVLTNGLLIEEIPIELRTERICINALKWELKSTDIIGGCEIRKNYCYRIMQCFPPDILISGFVCGHLADFT